MNTTTNMEKVFTASNRNMMLAGMVFENLTTGKYHVVLRDLDAEENAPIVKIFPREMYKAACEYASKVAGF